MGHVGEGYVVRRGGGGGGVAPPTVVNGECSHNESTASDFSIPGGKGISERVDVYCKSFGLVRAFEYK